MRVVVTIAGSDSGGGAGIQADIKTFEAHKVFGASIITAITAQNTVDVSAVYALPPQIVLAQLEAVFIDFPVAAVKIGMLANAEIVLTVAQFLATVNVPIVLDPVMISTTQQTLLQPDAIELLKTRLLPLSTVFTPNVHEATALTNIPIQSISDARNAAASIAQHSPDTFILIKGGHIQLLNGEAPRTASDILYKNGEYHRFDAPYIETRHTHGTGCTLSSAIAANLALGFSVPQAVKQAKDYVTDAIHFAPTNLGHGQGPLRHNLDYLR